MADRSVSLELETNEHQSVFITKVKKWKRKYKSEYVKKALIVSLNQTRATNMHFVPCALLIFRLHMAVGRTVQCLPIPR